MFKAPSATAFAPVNIALIKYWGKRDEVLNLPITSSLSISLNTYGAKTCVQIIDAAADQVFLAGQMVSYNESFYLRVVKFLDLVRSQFNLGALRFSVSTQSNLPIASGLASSASGFAALALALDKLLGLNLSLTELSKLARRGSGSAARSLYQGFALWHAGQELDGSDCFAEPIKEFWPSLRIGLLIFNSTQKAVSSTNAMRASVQTCPFYKLWPSIVSEHLELLQAALIARDFKTFASLAETNALYMHSLMQASTPAIIYAGAHTLECMRLVWQLRAAGVAIYFTQDAGPNLKLIYEVADSPIVFQHFAEYNLLEVDVFNGIVV